MSEQRGNGPAGAGRWQRRMSGPVWLVVLLGLCLLGGAVLAGAAEVVLGWSLPFFVMASSAIGIGTWLPLALSTRSLPNESGTS
jgi:4-amino-4-deoxy-L-arabinose transferase-like glycosyltransferase